jgi:large subunit ribosomal protein L4
VAVVSRWDFAAPKTREARIALAALGVEGRVLVVLGPEEELAAKSFRNLPEVHVLAVGELNAYDVLCSDWVVFTEATLPRPTAAEEGA